MQGAQILRNEACIWVRRNDEGCSATQQMGFLRSHHSSLRYYYRGGQGESEALFFRVDNPF